MIVLGTDGIWEAHNPNGVMIGKQAIYDIIRRNSSASASEIIDAIIQAVVEFQGKTNADDDLTLVVIKILEDS